MKEETVIINETVGFTSEKCSPNTYRLWDIHARDGFIISIHFQHVEMYRQLENVTEMFFGDDVDTFFITSDSCVPWTRLTNEMGELDGMYTKFASSSSNIKLVAFGLPPASRILIRLHAMKVKGKIL